MRKTVAIRDSIEVKLEGPGVGKGERTAAFQEHVFSRGKVAKARDISERRNSQNETQKGEIISDKLFSEGITVEDRKNKEHDIIEVEDDFSSSLSARTSGEELKWTVFSNERIANDDQEQSEDPREDKGEVNSSVRSFWDEVTKDLFHQ